MYYITKESKVPSKRSLELADQAKSFVLSTDIVKNEWAKSYVQNRTNDRYRYAYDLDLLQEFIEPGSSVCEHGAAPFVLSTAIAYAGYKVIASDLDPYRFGDMSYFPFETLQYDVENPVGINIDGLEGVIFNELFEHCRFDLLSTLNDLNRTLKPGGYLFLSTPNLKSAIGWYKYIFKNNAYGVAGDIYH